MHNRQGLAPIGILVLVIVAVLFAGGGYYGLKNFNEFNAIDQSAKGQGKLMYDQMVMDEFSKLGILEQVGFGAIAKAKTVGVALPSNFDNAQWGPVEKACEDGGYSILPHAGAEVLLGFVQTKEMHGGVSPVDIVVMSRGGAVLCVYKITKSTKDVPGPVPGVFPVLQKSYAVSPGTSSWKTYRNEEYGFEFQYPANFQEQPKRPGAGTLLSARNDNLYISAYLRRNDKVDTILSSVPDAEKFQVANHLAYKYFYWEGAGYSGVVLIQMGSDALYLSYDAIGKISSGISQEAHVKSYLDQILSTFKFTK